MTNQLMNVISNSAGSLDPAIEVHDKTPVWYGVPAAQPPPLVSCLEHLQTVWAALHVTASSVIAEPIK